MSSALGDKKGRVADSSDLTRLKRESAVLAAYTTYTGLSVNKKARQQVGSDRKFTLTRGGLTLKADATTGQTYNPITGNLVLAPYTPPIYKTIYAIPDFSTATYISGTSAPGDPYIVSSGGQQYSVEVSSVLNPPLNFGGQQTLIRTTNPIIGWVTNGDYNSSDGSPIVLPGDSLIITAPSSFVLSGYSLASGFSATNSMTSWTLSGSADGTTFKTIDTKTNQDLTDLTAIFAYSLPSNTIAYKVYKLVIDRMQPSNSTRLAIRQFNLFTTIVSSE